MLQIEAAPSHAGETVDTSAVDILEAQLVDKYTAHLYAQWEKDDGSAKQNNSTATKPASANKGTTSSSSANKGTTSSSLAKTGDAMPAGLVVLLAFLAVFALGVALGIRKRARK